MSHRIWLLSAVTAFTLLCTTTAVAQTGSMRSYVVQPGDTWFTLAWRFGLDDP
jgi:hypothetical protein